MLRTRLKFQQYRLFSQQRHASTIKRVLAESLSIRLAVSFGSAYVAYRMVQPLFWFAGLAAGYGAFRYVHRKLADYATNERYPTKIKELPQYRWFNMFPPLMNPDGDREDDRLRSQTATLLVALAIDGKLQLPPLEPVDGDDDQSVVQHRLKVGRAISISQQMFFIWPPVIGRRNHVSAVFPVYYSRSDVLLIAYVHVTASMVDGAFQFDEITIEYADSGRRVRINDKDLLRKLQQQQRQWIDVDGQ